MGKEEGIIYIAAWWVLQNFYHSLNNMFVQFRAALIYAYVLMFRKTKIKMILL